MTHQSIVTILVIVGTVIIVITASILFYRKFSQPVGIKIRCINSYGYELKYVPGEPVSKEYKECIENRTRAFLEKEYEVTRDLCKSFLTLLAGLLVGSITFSEKIVNFNSASRTARSLMISCWLCLLLAIVACGAGLTLMTVAAGWAIYQPFSDYFIFEEPAIYLFLFAGISFGSGLACLISSGVISMTNTKTVAEH